jgi:hypothetical protein
MDCDGPDCDWNEGDYPVSIDEEFRRSLQPQDDPWNLARASIALTAGYFIFRETIPPSEELTRYLSTYTDHANFTAHAISIGCVGTGATIAGIVGGSLLKRLYHSVRESLSQR